MPSRKGQAKDSQWERRGDFSVEGAPNISRHARKRMKQRNVGYQDIIKNKRSAGIVANEATGQVITVIPEAFVQHQNFLHQQRRDARNRNLSASVKTHNGRSADSSQPKSHRQKQVSSPPQSQAKRVKVYPSNIVESHEEFQQIKGTIHNIAKKHSVAVSFSMKKKKSFFRIMSTTDAAIKRAWKEIQEIQIRKKVSTTDSSSKAPAHRSTTSDQVAQVSKIGGPKIVTRSYSFPISLKPTADWDAILAMAEEEHGVTIVEGACSKKTFNLLVTGTRINAKKVFYSFSADENK